MEKFFIKTSPSLLGCRVVSMRYPHKKTVRDFEKIDRVLGTFNGYAPYLPNTWARKRVERIQEQSHVVKFEFEKLPDGCLRIKLVDNLPAYKNPGDIRRYAIEDDHNYKLKPSEIDVIPDFEDENKVIYSARVEYRIVVLEK